MPVVSLRTTVRLFCTAAALFCLVYAPALASARLSPTRVRVISYRAHDGRLRHAYLLLPRDYNGRPIALVISPHGRGVDARQNARFFGNLPGLDGFAVVSPEGQGRRLTLYSWGASGQIADLARMPQIVARFGVNVDPHRIFAVGGSMGGQEVLLLVARYPHLLAGAAAFDPATDMARRYRDFGALQGGRRLQRLARQEIGGTPLTAPAAYARRSPDNYVRQIARSGVPLQLYWSTRDRVITDQVDETELLLDRLRKANPSAPILSFRGLWAHTVEMWPRGRLPGALARFGLLPASPVPGAPARFPTRR